LKTHTLMEHLTKNYKLRIAFIVLLVVLSRGTTLLMAYTDLEKQKDTDFMKRNAGSKSIFWPKGIKDLETITAPLNHLTNSTVVKPIANAPFGPQKPSACEGQLDQEPNVGWYYDTKTGQVWAATDNCAKSDTFSWSLPKK